MIRSKRLHVLLLLFLILFYCKFLESIDENIIIKSSSSNSGCVPVIRWWKPFSQIYKRIRVNKYKKMRNKLRTIPGNILQDLYPLIEQNNIKNDMLDMLTDKKISIDKVYTNMKKIIRVLNTILYHHLDNARKCFSKAYTPPFSNSNDQLMNIKLAEDEKITASFIQNIILYIKTKIPLETLTISYEEYIQSISVQKNSKSVKNSFLSTFCLN